MKYEKLFSPIKMRGVTFPNRTMKTAMVSRLAAEDGSVTDEIKDRYRREARGGVGSIVVEAAVVIPSRSSHNLRISDDQFIPHLKEIADAIRSGNREVAVGIQIMSFLKVARSGWKQEVEDVTHEELNNKIQWHAQAARRAVEAGYDFIEFHNAHGFEMSSFLSLVNKRTDNYGGRLLEDRMRFSTEMFHAIRDAIGEDVPLGVRINGEDFIRPGTTVKQSKIIARRFAEMGADYISISVGDRFEDSTPPPGMPPFPSWGYSGARMSPKWWSPDGTNVYLSEEIRSYVRDWGLDTPIVTVGKIRTPELAEEILQKGQADIIGLCRPLLADPDWPNKAKEGRAEYIVTCCACGYCNDLDGLYKKIRCILWEKEHRHAPEPFLLEAPCKAGCPAGIDIEGYIQAIIDGDYKGSLELIKQKCPFPGVVSRVCPRPCEKKCNRKDMDDPIAINGLKRLVVEEVEKRWGRAEVKPVPQTREEKVAVIGSGPAGLTTAYDLVKMGYGVTVYEGRSFAGGMMANGISEAMLPRKIVRTEIEDILRLGVELKLNSPVGANGLTLEKLRQQGYGAFFIAVGDGKNAKGDVPHISFLNKENYEVTTKDRIEVHPQTFATKVEGVFAGGDIVSGQASVIRAIAAGQKAAVAIDQYLRGQSPEHKQESPKTVSLDDVKIEDVREQRVQIPRALSKTGKPLGPKDLKLEFNESSAVAEAGRCLDCRLRPRLPELDIPDAQ